MIEAEAVSFTSDGVVLAGSLLRPIAETSAAGCVILCHGFSGTMDRLRLHADRFGEAGLAAFTFDYRNFGRSSGSPRQLVDITGQQRDIHAAVRFVRSTPGIDPSRIGLWGNSLGGAHVITVAARDRGVAAVVSQIPFNGFPRRLPGRSRRSALALTAAIAVDVIRARLGLDPSYIKMVGAPGELAVTATPDAFHHIQALAGADPDTTWENRIAPRALLAMSRYRPADDAPCVRAPVLLCAAEADVETPLERVRQLCRRLPQAELRVYPGTHFDFYGHDETRRAVLEDQVRFLSKHLRS